MNNNEIFEKYLDLRTRLIGELNDDGFWTGRLSTSALSTAVAIVALKVAHNPEDRSAIHSGYTWLCRNINDDGGYGDTKDSLSNVSTTLLCFAAVKYCQTNDNGSAVLSSMGKWLSEQGIMIDPESITTSVLEYYGKDYTFSIPILSMLTLCGVIPQSGLNKIPVLPFELALLPASFYRFINLRVVSYALPALIGVGIYLHRQRAKGLFYPGIFRNRFIKPALRRLNKLVPASGGFLEAIPLTAFVSMCLIESNEHGHDVVVQGLKFLRLQQRADGGWPIDTDLSTWVTTLSVKAIGPQVFQALDSKQSDQLRKHLLSLQYKNIHPFNGAKPGGWGWTSFSGSVPDADDTPGALLALLELYTGNVEECDAITNGCSWLIDLQNKDGGFPTFCKGWGRLPFDKSCADLTGHALLALLKTSERLHHQLPGKLIVKIDKSSVKALDYLSANQSADGSWLPLWFGNQLSLDKTNPVYGTAKVSIYLGDCLPLQRPKPEILDLISSLVSRAKEFLLREQNEDGSWGGSKHLAGTLEETALAVSALASDNDEPCMRGIEWMCSHEDQLPAPIGLYFAMLWYDEKLYPLIYRIEALRRFLGY